MNPSAAPVPVVLMLVDPDHNPAGKVERTLAPKSMIYGQISELFPAVSKAVGFLIVGASTLDSGLGVAACEVVTIAGAGSSAMAVSNGLFSDGLSGIDLLGAGRWAWRPGDDCPLINTSNYSRTANVRVRLADGSTAGAKPVTLAQLGYAEIDLMQFLGLDDGTIGTLEVSTDGPGVIGSVLFGDPEKGYSGRSPAAARNDVRPGLPPRCLP